MPNTAPEIGSGGGLAAAIAGGGTVGADGTVGVVGRGLRGAAIVFDSTRFAGAAATAACTVAAIGRANSRTLIRCARAPSGAALCHDKPHSSPT